MRGIEPRAFHMQSERSTTELHPQSDLLEQNWRVAVKKFCPRWGSNSRPSDYETDALPTALRRHCVSMYKIFSCEKNVCTHGGTRTPNLRFRRPTPYPLGHAGTYRWEGSNKVTTRANRPKMTYASPGNRTRVARMGILHDTTTPATHHLLH